MYGEYISKLKDYLDLVKQDFCLISLYGLISCFSVAEYPQTASSAQSLSSEFVPPKPSNPRLDWFQQIGAVTLVLYARQVSRLPGRVPPWVRVTLNETGKKVGILVCNVGGEPGVTYEARLVLSAAVKWPCVSVMTHPDSGKVEVVFKKETEGLWTAYGVPAEGHGTVSQDIMADSLFWPVHLVEETEVNYNSKMLKFQFLERVCFTLPVGHHLRIQTKIQGTASHATKILSRKKKKSAKFTVLDFKNKSKNVPYPCSKFY